MMAPLRGKSGVLLWFLGSLWFCLLGCEKEELPELVVDPGSERHVFAIDFQNPTPARKVRTMMGIQGSPASVIPGDPDLISPYQQYGFEIVRIPQDDFCAYTLEGVFQDADLPVSELASYNFGNVDHLIDGILASGAEVLWQAIYDVGSGGPCASFEDRHTGQIVEDPNRFVNVVNNVLRHFNEGETDWDPEGKEYGVRYVEYLNDPMGLGGYTLEESALYFDHYRTFAQGIRAAFDGASAQGTSIKLIGPAHHVRSWGDLRLGEKDFVFSFIDQVVDENVPLDILSLQFRMDAPYEMGWVVEEVRNYLDQRGLVEIPIWITEVAPSEEQEKALRDEGIEVYAEYVGAHLVASKIAWQETVERVFPHRGTRRRYNGTGSVDLVESAFFDAQGGERGGFWASTHLRRMKAIQFCVEVH